MRDERGGRVALLSWNQERQSNGKEWHPWRHLDLDAVVVSGPPF